MPRVFNPFELRVRYVCLNVIPAAASANLVFFFSIKLAQRLLVGGFDVNTIVILSLDFSPIAQFDDYLEIQLRAACV